MSSHVELNPDDDVLGLTLGMKAMRLALTQKTHKTGTMRIPTDGDTDIIIGSGAEDGANRVDKDGNQLPLVDTSAIDKAAQDAAKKADEAAKKADRVRSGLQSEVDKVSAMADAVDAKADRIKADADKISQKADADKAELDKSVSALDAKVTDLSGKGDQLAGQITDIQGTVNGQQTQLTEFSQKLEGEITRGDTTVKSVSELKQTVTGLSSTVSQTTKTADAALSKATQVEQTANGISATLSKDYTSTKDADLKYAAKTELKATADGLQANITKSQQTADGAVSKANAAQLTADGVKATLAKDYTSTKDADAKYSTKAELEASSESISASLSAVKQTADGAVSAASKAQQTADGISVSLSKNYQTKAQADTAYATKASLKATSDSLSSQLTATTKTASDALSKATQVEQTANGVKATLSKDYTSTKDADLKYSTKAELSATADKLSADLSSVSKTASGALDKANALEVTASGLDARISETAKTLDSTVETVNRIKSTADSNSAKLSQVSENVGGVSKRTSELEQNLSGFKSEVSETYTSKKDFDSLTIGGGNLLLNSDFSNGLNNWVLELQTNGLGTVTADKLSGFDFATTMCTISIPKAITGMCRIYQSRTPNPMRTDTVDTVSFWAKASTATSLVIGRINDQHWVSIGTTWKRYSITVQQWRNSNAFCIGLKTGFSGTVKITKLMWEHASKPSAWSPAPEDLQPAGDYSTKSYVNQTAKSVALGVVQNYQGSDGSGLATKSDITVAKKSITSTVASTYATKSGVTQEISSKIDQNNNSLDVKFSTKMETQNAQNKANTADSHATDAQSRVGSLEDCINFTASGVRVGKRSNGKFTGVSALVNTNGTFDLLDASGNLLTRINRHRFQVTGDDGTGSGYLSLSQDGINITVQPTADASKTYHIQVGKSGVGITAPDRSSIECSASGGLNIETVKFGKIAIGSGGLQFTNDQGWGLKLSAAGWSIKWAGNHTLATGPKAGALYIDGHEIVTR